MATIKKLSTFFVNTNNPANAHIRDINTSIDAYNRTPTLPTLLELQAKVKRYEFAKLSVTTAIDLKAQIDRELDGFKKAADLEFVFQFLVATANCRAGGRTLQIDGGGGDAQGEGGGYKSWVEHGFKNVVAADKRYAMMLEETAHQLSQKLTADALSTPLTAFLNKQSALQLNWGGVGATFVTWVRYFRGQGICAQKTSSDAKQWLTTLVNGVPHFKPLGSQYSLLLNNATSKGEKEYSDYITEKNKRAAEAAKRSLGNLQMPNNWQVDCYTYGDDMGNWVLQEFVRLNKDKELPVVSNQFKQVTKAVDDHLGKDWRNARTPNFKTAWDDRNKPNKFERPIE